MLLFSEGFDSYDVVSSAAGLLQERWTLCTYNGAANTVTINKLGAQVYEDTERCLFVTTSSSPAARISKTLAPGDATCIFGFALALFNNPPAAARSIAYIATGGAGTTVTPNNTGIQLSIVINTDKTISVYQGYFEGGSATLLGTSVATLANFDASLHVFQYLEIKATINNPSGSVDVRLSSAYNNFGSGDPVPAFPSASILSLSGVNTGPFGTSGGLWWDTISLVGTATFADRFMTIDDVYVADGTGANGDFIGPIVVASAGTEPYATIAATYESGGGGGFSNGGALDTGDGGKNVGQGSFVAGRYADDGANTFVVAAVLGGMVTAHIDVPQAPPALPVYYSPDRGVASVVVFHDMKRIVTGSPLLLAQGMVRYPGGVAGADYLGRQLNSQSVNVCTGVGTTTDQQLADPWDTDPTLVQWTRAHLYSKLLGTNAAAAEFGIKCIGQDGNPDCQLGKIFVDVIYGHFIVAPVTIASVSPSHGAPLECGIEIIGTGFLAGDEGSICAPGTSVVSAGGTVLTCCLPAAGALNVAGVPFDPGPYDVTIGSVTLAFGFTGDVMSTIAIPFNDAVKQFFDSNGKPLALGFVKTFVAGSATPQPTYSDPALTAQNGAAGVAQLDSAGKITMYMLPTTYKVTVTDVNGVTQDGYPIDNVPGSIWPGAIGAQVTTNPAVGANSLAHQFAATMNKASSGTHALFAANYFAAPTIGAGGATLTEASTVYIAGPPTLGSTVFALHVASGIAKFDGAVQVPGGFTGSMGFYGTAPIAQQVLATGAGHSVDNVISALQALGLVKQA